MKQSQPPDGGKKDYSYILLNNTMNRGLSFDSSVLIRLPYDDRTLKRCKHVVDLILRGWSQGGPFGFDGAFGDVSNAWLQVCKLLSLCPFCGSAGIFGSTNVGLLSLHGRWHFFPPPFPFHFRWEKEASMIANLKPESQIPSPNYAGMNRYEEDSEIVFLLACWTRWRSGFRLSAFQVCMYGRIILAAARLRMRKLRNPKCRSSLL